MSENLPDSPPPLQTPPPASLQAVLRKEFEEVFCRHSALSPHEAFCLQAAKLHQEVLTKTAQVQFLKRQITLLSYQLGLECPQTRRNHSCGHSGHTQSREQEKRKRMRRTAVEIARHYACNIDKCNKSYGSEGSLNQHIKIKHRYYYTKHLMLLDAANTGKQEET